MAVETQLTAGCPYPAIIITVICIIGGLSVLTYKLGITSGLRITFFPMIIFFGTIERMSILWGRGRSKRSPQTRWWLLLVAVIAYLAMSSGMIQHPTFNFLATTDHHGNRIGDG